MTVEVDRNYLAMLEKAYEEYKRLTKPKEKQANYEKIKNMSVEEMAEFLDVCSGCEFCAARHNLDYCPEEHCIDGIKKWLESEAK